MLKIVNRGCHGNGSEKMKKNMNFCSTSQKLKKGKFQENLFFLFPTEFDALLKISKRNPRNQPSIHDDKMHVTYRILEHYCAFHFFQQPFLNGIHCFSNDLRQIVKMKVSFEA